MKHDDIAAQLSGIAFLASDCSNPAGLTSSTDEAASKPKAAKTKTAKAASSESPAKPKAKVSKKIAKAKAPEAPKPKAAKAKKPVADRARPLAIVATVPQPAKKPARPNTSSKKRPPDKTFAHDAYGWRLPVSFQLPARSRFGTLHGESFVRVELGRNNSIVITGDVEDLKLAASPTVTGMLTASRVYGMPRRCSLKLELATGDLPAYELRLGNHAGARWQKDLGDCMMSIMRQPKVQLAIAA